MTLTKRSDSTSFKSIVEILVRKECTSFQTVCILDIKLNQIVVNFFPNDKENFSVEVLYAWPAILLNRRENWLLAISKCIWKQLKIYSLNQETWSDNFVPEAFDRQLFEQE